MTWPAMARAVARSPELKAGCPQQVCDGTSTLQPASSRSLTAAKPIEGLSRSTRQVTKRPTRGFWLGKGVGNGDLGEGSGHEARFALIFKHSGGGGAMCRASAGLRISFGCSNFSTFVNGEERSEEA